MKLFEQYYDPTILRKHIHFRMVDEHDFKNTEDSARWNMYDKAFLTSYLNGNLSDTSSGVNKPSEYQAASSAAEAVLDETWSRTPTTAPTEPWKGYDATTDAYPNHSFGEGESDNNNNNSKQKEPEKEKDGENKKDTQGVEAVPVISPTVRPITGAVHGYDADKDSYPADSVREDTRHHHHHRHHHHRRQLGEKERDAAEAKLVIDEASFKDCDVTIEIIENSAHLQEHVCPGICRPHPRAIVALDMLRVDPQEINKDLTCSMTLTDVFPRNMDKKDQYHNNKQRVLDGDENDTQRSLRVRDVKEDEGDDVNSREHARLAILLDAIARRKVEECLESQYWTSGRRMALQKETRLRYPEHHRDPPKRKVKGLILWISSLTRFSLARAQINILTKQKPATNSDSNDRIVGWLATEETYPCRIGTTICTEVSDNLAYFNYMPTTRLNVASAGYSCAQRRPLRSVAHLLKLFDPSWLLIVDDDTYVNFNLLTSNKLQHYINTHMKENPAIMGQLTMGRKITKHGFFYGGAGYLLGQNILNRLTSHTLMGPPQWSANDIDPVQMTALSVLKQTYLLSDKNCKGSTRGVTGGGNGGNTCVFLDRPYDYDKGEGVAYGNHGTLLPVDTTVIDVCMNIMSEEHTCYHSDHALSRCFVHATYADIVNVACPGIELNGMKVGMCMGTDKCDPDVHLTCHRWMPAPTNLDVAVAAVAEEDEE